MKKILGFTLLIAILNLFIISCSNDDNNSNNNLYTDTDTIPEVYEINVTSFTEVNPSSYIFRAPFTLSNSEHLLIYRQTNVTTSGNPVWELLPSTYADNYGTVSYNYDFSMEDFTIYVDGYKNIANLNPEYITNQWFRIVVLPGFFPSTQSTTPPVDYTDYNAVINYFHIDEAKTKLLK